MTNRLGILAIALLVSIPSLAQTGPCSGGGTNPLFGVMPLKGAPGYALTFEHSTVHTLDPPQVKIAGNTITVTQTPLDLPPPPLTAGAAAANCNLQTVTLGVLAPGSYNVVWQYALPSGVPPPPGADPGLIIVESYNFSFQIAEVPALSGPVLLALALFLAAAGAVVLGR